MFSNVTIGCDPELFLKDKTGKFIASCDKIGGTKEEPLQIVGLPRGFAVQEDNVAVEFCIPPAHSKVEFVSNIADVITEIRSRYVNPIGLDLAFGVASYNFTEDQLQSIKAQTMGCDPDYNVYTMEENVKPKSTEGLRTAGGHIHIGWDNPIDTDRVLAIRAADICLGLPSLFIDGDVKRRQMYGKAGAFRFKSYGVEYRTLSNFWIQSKELTEWAYEQTMKAVDLAANGGKKLLDPAIAAMVQMAINKNNKQIAKAAMKKFGVTEYA